MRPDSIRFTRAHRSLVYATLGVLFLSGAAWAWLNYFTVAPDDFGSASKSIAMKIHGGAAMAVLVLIGIVLNGHVKFAWRAGRNRINGAIFLGAFALLTGTGYGLYYAGGEKLRALTSWIHLSAGLILPILLLIHVLLGRRTRAATERKHHHSPARVDITGQAQR
jgi:hypothetical protein